MTDPDILHELRLLADLGQNLHRLQAVHEGLQSSLAGTLQEAAPAQKAVLEAALQLDHSNDVLRSKLALECEQKRCHLIRNCKSRFETTFIVQLENAFQLDWYSNSNLSSPAAESELPEKTRSVIAEKVSKWGFDRDLKEQILEALQPGSDPFVSDERLEEDVSYQERHSLSAPLPGSSSLPSLSSHESFRELALRDVSFRDQLFGYGFPLDPATYKFDDEPESSIQLQPLSPGAGTESIKAGSLHKLIERLTDDKTQDLNLRFVFLLTYHSFTSSREFLDLLVERYCVPFPPNSTPNEVIYFQNYKRKGIRLKVFSVLKKWVEDHYSDFLQDDDLSAHLKDLLKTCFSDEPWSRKLSATILNVIQKQESGSSRNTLLDLEHRAPSPEFRCFASVDEIESKFADISPLEFARQLCISDFEVFRRIEPRECLNQAWSKPDRNVQAPNIMRMIQRFNHVSQWTQWVVLSAPTRAQRQLFLRHMIRIGERCLALNNFTSACAIYAGLESNSVYRLRNVWDALPYKIAKLYEALQGTFKSDSKTKQRFRTLLQEAIPPCIPHLGLFLSDLTFIEDGNADNVGGLINFAKRRKLSERIMWIKQYQQVGYQLAKVPVLQEYLVHSLVVRNDDELYNLSKQIKP